MKTMVKENYLLFSFLLIIVTFLYIASIRVKEVNVDSNRYKILVNK